MALKCCTKEQNAESLVNNRPADPAILFWLFSRMTTPAASYHVRESETVDKRDYGNENERRLFAA